MAHRVPLPSCAHALQRRELHFPGGLAISLPGRFSQWEALAGDWLLGGGEKPGCACRFFLFLMASSMILAPAQGSLSLCSHCAFVPGWEGTETVGSESPTCILLLPPWPRGEISFLVLLISRFCLYFLFDSSTLHSPVPQTPILNSVCLKYLV